MSTTFSHVSSVSLSMMHRHNMEQIYVKQSVKVVSVWNSFHVFMCMHASMDACTHPHRQTDQSPTYTFASALSLWNPTVLVSWQVERNLCPVPIKDAHTHTHMHIHTHAHTHTCTHTHAHIHTHTCTHMRACTHTCVQTLFFFFSLGQVVKVNPTVKHVWVPVGYPWYCLLCAADLTELYWGSPVFTYLLHCVSWLPVEQ